VFDNVAFGLVERRLPREQIRRRTEGALELVGLGEYAARRPNQLSGGQQQRVALARTVVIEPQVLLLDEPLSNLDKKLRVTMRQELLALQRKLGITTIFVTHDQEEAMTTADRMAVLDGGIVQQIGPPSELYDFPANRFVAGFVGTTNLLDGVLAADGADTVSFDTDGAGRLLLPRAAETPPAGRLSVSFRPHVLRMQPADAPRDREIPWLVGAVEAAEFLGEVTRYRVRVGTAALTVDQAHLGGAPKFADGAPVAVGLPPSQLRYLRD
jgi:iron(III) transport system ATP-binding protein